MFVTFLALWAKHGQMYTMEIKLGVSPEPIML